jgi:hypothetical protein
MRLFAILLAALLIGGCKVDAPAPNIDNINTLFAASKQCRDFRGRFAKCNYTCWDGSRVYALSQCPIQPPPPPAPCPEGTQLNADGHCEAIPAPEPTPVPPPPEPTPEPPPAPEPVPTDPLIGESPIASNFDINQYLVKNGTIPISAKPDVVGAFRFICNAGQILRDDPIVFPGQPGKSHLHQFYGNTSANANSTYKSLRETGDSTCGKPLNRSAYWMPAMLDGNGNVVRPDFVSIYYKRRPKSDPKCQSLGSAFGAEGKCVNLPNGLKFIFGYDMLTGKSPTGWLWFNCGGAKFQNLEAPDCNVPGRQIGAVIEAPDCWDGKNLDSANHRDHVAHSFYDGNTGQKRCDDAHPYVIPAFTLGAWFTVPQNGKMQLSSDAMVPGAPRGTTFHADFWMAWDPIVHNMWEDNCLDKLLNCSAGELGNGMQIQDGWLRNDPAPKVVPIP